MSDKIFDLIKENVSKAISSEVSVPENKQQQTVDVTAHALASGLKNNLSLNNISDLMGLFGGGSSSAGNPVVNNIESTVVNALVSKVGLSQSLATTIAATVIPVVMNAFKSKVDDPGEKDFNLKSIVESLSGGGNNGILGSLGKLFS